VKNKKSIIATLSGSMRSASENIPLPERFRVEDGPRDNCVIIVDTQTNRSIKVALCDLFGARMVLNAFFA
jgi:hypothetical protein